MKWGFKTAHGAAVLLLQSNPDSEFIVFWFTEGMDSERFCGLYSGFGVIYESTPNNWVIT